MRFSPNQYKLSTAMTIGIALGVYACGGQAADPRPIDRTADIASLTVEEANARASLATEQQEFADYQASLPAECIAAARPYLPGGLFFAVSNIDASVNTDEWCGPYNSDAVPHLRQYNADIAADQEEVTRISEAIMANLAASGVTVPK